MAVGKRRARKPLAWLCTIRPSSKEAREEADILLVRLQEGEILRMPHSRPMPSVGPRCYELRIRDENRIWRVVYRIDRDAIVVARVFSKTTPATSKHDIDECKKILRKYDAGAREARRESRRS